MRVSTGLSLGLIVAGLAVVALAVVSGAAHLALLVIVPVIYGSSLLFGLGVLLIVVGMVGLFLGGTAVTLSTEDQMNSGAASQRSAPSTSVGGVVLLGPIPIIFGSEKGWTPYLIVLAVVILIALIVAAVLLAGGSGTVLVP